eukprot:CAMPEP_0170631350 /NCGR_PEP_ID=MMETSP0224-20130122/34579_1 /TAXON_ID=285029 /ORGANISM="Togula jolla, Strain CCCM 725" /LENGTH=151 /DNA_ID=CAMNT_0010959653 /DNA_START=562 /DNA_END=1016 /DNA_ORIENTATION=-
MECSALPHLRPSATWRSDPTVEARRAQACRGRDLLVASYKRYRLSRKSYTIHVRVVRWSQQEDAPHDPDIEAGVDSGSDGAREPETCMGNNGSFHAGVPGHALCVLRTQQPLDLARSFEASPSYQLPAWSGCRTELTADLDPHIEAGTSDA